MTFFYKFWKKARVYYTLSISRGGGPRPPAPPPGFVTDFKLYGLPDCSLSRLQRILNTAARILCKIPKFDHITKTLLDLYWLPIQQRIRFKILILTYQAYHKTAP